MTIREVIGYTKNWMQGQLINGTELDEYFEAWCSENGYDSADEDNVHDYIDELLDYLYSLFEMKFNPSTGTPLALGFQEDAEEVMEQMEGEDEDDHQYICKMIARKLDNPFFHEWDWYWVPVCHGVAATFGEDAGKLREVEGEIGQKLVLGFCMQGTDGPLAWAYVYYSI